MKTKVKDFLMLLALPILFFSCSSDEPGGDEDNDYVDSEMPGHFETMLNSQDSYFSHNGNDYSFKQYDWRDLYYPSWLYYPTIYRVPYAFSLRSADKEAEILDNLHIGYKNADFKDIPVFSGLEIFNKPLRADGDFENFCIDGNAFNNCKKLKKVYIDAHWYAISGTSAQAFYGCDNLTDIYMCEPLIVESKKFAVDYDKVILHVRPGLKEAFQISYPWKNFKHVVDDYDECDRHCYLTVDACKSMLDRDYFFNLASD